MTYDSGVYDITNAQYHADAAISRSSLMLMLKSPFHFKHQDMVEFKESKSMRIGSMVHTLTLEPHLFDSEYVTQPDFNKRTKAGKEEFALWSESVKGKSIAEVTEIETAKLMSKSLTDNHQISSILTDCNVEKSIFWTDEKTGIALKARPDAWNGSIIIDLKTTKDATPRKFMYSCLDYGYFIQAAMIQEALRSIGQVMERYFIVCVENSAPYAHAIFVLDEAAIEYGYSQFRACLDRLSECMKTGEWPSYEIQMLNIPAYMRDNDG